MCFAAYCCGALSIFALFTSSLSYCSVSLDCEVHVLHDHHHLLSLDFRRCADDGKFVLQLGLQLTSVLPSLLVSTGSFLFVTGRGLLGLILVTLFVVIVFTSTRALHDALRHVRFHVLDDSSSSAVCCDFASVDFYRVPSRPSRTSAVQL